MSSYEEGLGTRARRFLSDTFGFRGSRNVTAWLVAGVAAYYLFYLPEKQRMDEIQVARQAAKQRAIELGLVEVDRVRPIHRQDTGLIKGKAGVQQQQQQQQQEQDSQQQQQQPQQDPGRSGS